MLASTGHVELRNHVLGSPTGVASQTGISATGPFDLEFGLNYEVDVEQLLQEEEIDCAVAGDDDGISPDDAPELVCDDLNGEV